MAADHPERRIEEEENNIGNILKGKKGSVSLPFFIENDIQYLNS